MEQIDPTQFMTEIPDNQMPSGENRVTLGMGAAGMTLPVEHIALPGEAAPTDEDALSPAEAAALAEAQLPPGAAPAPPDATAPPLPQELHPDPTTMALQQRLALLEAELATMRQPPAPAPPAAPPPPPPAPTTDELIGRVAQRFERTFGDIDSMDAEDPTYQRSRSNAFARTIVQAVLEDLAATQQQPLSRDDVTHITREFLTQEFQNYETKQLQRSETTNVITRAVAVAREAGYDVHPPDSAQHRTSPESVMFWALGSQFSTPGLTVEDDTKGVLKHMPSKRATPATPAAPEAPARPQPLGRQGAGRTPAAPGGTTEEYEPKTMNQLMEGLLSRQRIGGTA